MSKKSSQVQTELESFYEEGWITNVLHVVKSGKEATVYCCQADPNTGREFIAAKVYRARQNRNFKNSAVYREGTVILDKRAARAVKKKTEFGRKVEENLWQGHEFEMLTRLYQIGANVPEPLSLAENAMLMEYLGGPRQPAPVLNNVELEPEEVRPIFDLLLKNIRLWLKHDLIHGDLSPFNILYWEGTIRVIDFPQSIDPRFNPNAFSLLLRDISNVCQHFENYGLRSDPQKIAGDLWQLFRNSQL